VQDTNHPTSFPWPSAGATGVGSMPGADPAEATRIILGELPDLPHLAELPGRGPGADLTGRTAALLIELPVEMTTSGWRFADRPGRDMRRAHTMLARDLDALEEAADGYQGPLKIQVCGPWTLAATIELARSQNAALADRSAVADLTESLAEGVAQHVAEVRRRVPGAQVLLQLDEPALPAVIEGSVPTASGFGRLPAVDAPDIETGLRTVLQAAGAPVLIHCCGLSVPFGMMKTAGADAVGFDLSQLRRGEEETLAELVEAGLRVFVGAVPATPGAAAGPSGGNHLPQRTTSGQLPSREAVAARVVELWRRMGWPAAQGAGGSSGIAAQVVITPACGLAGAPPEYAKAALACCREAGRLLPELIEEEAG
jgi:methionine synthase II (cobalamin-independent)